MKFKFNDKELLKKIEKLSEDKIKAVEREVDAALDLGADLVLTDAKLRVPVATSELRKSLEKVNDGHLSYRVGSPLDYARYVEYGTRGHWVPFEALEKWADKIGAPDYVAYIAWLKIAMRGTEAQPFLRPAFFKNETTIDRNVKQAVRRGLNG